MELLSGTGWIPSAIDEGEEAETIIHRWQEELERFKEVRQRYLIYD
jgi:beta-N-acetylhexosaminidase